MKSRNALLLLLSTAAASTLLGQVKITSPLAPASLPTGYSTIYYTYTFTAVSSNSPITWSVPQASMVNLPLGITVSANGTLAGTSPQSGTFIFQVTAQSPGFSDTETVILKLLNPVITIDTPPSLPNGFVGQSYSLNLHASSSPTGILWLPAAMPPGLSLSSDGIISGVPTVAGNYGIIATAQIGSTNITTTQQFSLNIYAGQVTIQTSQLPFVYSGQPYSSTLVANPVGIAWTLTGTLPPGITFDHTNGIFAGTSSLLGAYQLQLQGTFPNYLSATRNLTLYVTGGPLTVPQPILTPAVQGSPYTTNVTAAGGLPPYQWSFAGTNTNGLSIGGGSTAVISGTPVATGNFVFPVNVSDATGQSIVVNLSLLVANPLSIGTSSLPNGNVGVPYSQGLLASGGSSIFTWNIVDGSGALPPGLNLSTNGVISGTPTTAGSFPFTVRASDSGGRSATRQLTISIGVTAISISTSSLPSGQLTVPYSQTLAASGGVAPYNWTLVSGSLPPGLSLSAAGVISGTPSGSIATSSFTVQVTDSSPAPQLTAQKAFTIDIALTLAITKISLPVGTQGVAYPATQILASGGQQPYTWSIVSGALPTGLQFSATTGTISGTPTATGTTVFTVVVTDSAGQTSSSQFSLTVNAPSTPPSVTTTGSFTATVGTSFSLTLAAAGGTQPYTWSATGLPAGLQVSGSSVTGTPTAAGTANVTLTVTDAQQQVATAAIAITVSLPQTPAVTIGSIAANPATQATPTVTLSSAFPVAITGTLSVSFQSAVGGTPTEVGFISSTGTSSTANFTVAAGATKAVFSNSAVLATGTVAGTITVTLTSLNAGGQDITPSPKPTQTIVIGSSTPVIQSVKFSNTGGTLNVTVIGYSTTREMVSGQFTFAAASGSTLAQNAITVQLGPPFSTWYSSSASNQWGGQFMLTVPFTVAGNAATVVSVSVTLTNTKGTSAAVSPQ